MNAHLQRALMLLEQSRYELAEGELRQALAADPDDARAHAVLAICLTNLKQHRQAVEEAETAIHLTPDQPFPFYAQAIVLAGRNQFAKAKEAISTAIGLNPYDVHYFARLSQIELNQSNWQAALEAAEQGLSLDPEDVDCTNLRAIALTRLGKKIEAKDSLATALKRAPEDAFSHANMGWSLLEQKQPDKAMEHFREALRLDPELEWARMGIVEAMKARYFIYRVMLGWFLWMLKLQQKAQWAVIGGAYVGYLVLRNVARNNAALAPWIQPLLIAYVVFAVMTWLASPLFNLVLRTSKFGRLALSDEEVRTSNWVGLCVLGSAAFLGGYFFVGAPEFLGCALACGLIIPPLARIYAAQPGWPRAVMALMTLALGGLAVVITATLFVGHFIEGRLGLALTGAGLVFFLPFIVAAIAAQFATNYLVSVRPTRGTRFGQRVWRVGESLLAVAALLVVAFVGVAVLVGMSEDPVVFDSSIRTQMVPADDLAWTVLEELDRDTARFRELGFDEQGDFRTIGWDDARSRMLLNAEDGIWIELSESRLARYAAAVGSVYNDGRSFIYHNLPDDPLAIQPNATQRRFDLSPFELYERFKQDRPPEDIRYLTFDEVIATSDDLYRQQMDFLLSRGGPTDDEIIAYGKRNDIEFTPREIERIKSLWRRQASHKVDAYVIEQFQSSHPDYASIEIADFVCVHDLLSADVLAYRLREDREGDSRPSPTEVDQIDGVLRTIGPREAFARLVANSDGISKVGTTDDPIPVDIYLKKRQL